MSIEAPGRGVADRIRTLAASMTDLPLPGGAFDLVWAEGSAYLMGVDAALAAWRRLLAPGGAVVLTEAEWTTPDPAPAAREFWAVYPAMRTTADNVRAFADAGWTVTATYLLPDSDWAGYYGPLAERVERLRRERPADGPALDEVAREIGVRRDHGRDYGYTGYVLRPR